MRETLPLEKNLTGNVTADTRGGTAYNYAYNNRGRLAQLSIGSTVTANYTYDGLERLAVRTTENMTPSGTTQYLYDRAGHLIVEADGSGNTLTEYVWFDDMPIAVVANVDTSSPSFGVVVDGNGNFGTYDYGAYGASTGSGFFGGVSPSWSWNAKTICDLSGPFYNLGASGSRQGVTATGDYFWGNSPNGPVNGVTFTFGPGNGYSASSTTSYTQVHVIGSF